MRAVLDTAAAFEKASAADYLSMAQQTGDQALRAVFLHLAAEEEEHVRSLHALASSHADIAWGEHDKEIETIAGPKTPLSAARILDDAVAHEKATAGFYRELSRSAPLPAVRAAFARLADEEESHLAHLTDYRAGGSAAGASTG
jgi:rubrerythrin